MSCNAVMCHNFETKGQAAKLKLDRSMEWHEQ